MTQENKDTQTTDLSTKQPLFIDSVIRFFKRGWHKLAFY